jgi:lipopolysaccharide assembly outer membrane protein LptD (OstA)
MGTSIEAEEGFTLNLKNENTIKGEKAFINDEQTKFIITKLTEGVFKEIILSGEEVVIEKEKNGELIQAKITSGGKVIIKNENQSNLKAQNINWMKSGEVEAKNNVSYISDGKTFMANYLLLKPDKKIFAKDHVAIEHGKTQCFGESLSFENNSIITITGMPKAIQGNKQISANKIVYDINSGKVQATGNVRTVVINGASKT